MLSNKENFCLVYSDSAIGKSIPPVQTRILEAGYKGKLSIDDQRLSQI